MPYESSIRQWTHGICAAMSCLSATTGLKDRLGFYCSAFATLSIHIGSAVVHKFEQALGVLSTAHDVLETTLNRKVRDSLICMQAQALVGFAEDSSRQAWDSHNVFRRGNKVSYSGR